MWTRYESKFNFPLKSWTPNHFVPIFDSFESSSFIDIESSDSMDKTSIVEKILSDTSKSLSEEEISTDNSHSKLQFSESVNNAEISTAKMFEYQFAFNNEGKFFDTQCILKKIINGQNVGKKVPFGLKHNVSFLIDNTFNFSRRSESFSSVYPDDCCQWNHGSTNTYFFGLFGENFKIMIKKNDVFYSKTGNNLKNLIPAPESYIKVKHYQCTLKRDSQYKKKVTEIIDLVGDFPKNILKRSFVQYIGKPDTMRKAHGNSKVKNSRYIRTNPETLSTLRKEAQVQAPKQVYVNNIVKKDISEQPRDQRQIYNLKKLEKSSGRSSKSNIADDIQDIIANFTNGKDPFVKKLFMNLNNPPDIIMYTSSSIDFLNALRQNKNSKLHICIDRTFNLSNYFLTLTTFKFPFLAKKSSRESAILIGPMLLHSRANKESYIHFFNHLKSILKENLDGIILKENDIMFGTDQEIALVKAINDSFPDSHLTFCSKHLKDNLSRFLSEKIGMPLAEVVKIKNKFFHGLLECHDISEFTKLSIKYINECSQGKDEVYNYLDKLTKILEKHVFKKTEEPAWTNNNCESINFVIKSFLDWKIVRPTFLIKSLEKIVNTQINDIFRAFIGEGEYYVKEHFGCKLFERETWMELSDDEKIKKVITQIKMFKKMSSDEITSKDGKLVIKNHPLVAKKPGQRVRPKVCKTRKHYY